MEQNSIQQYTFENQTIHLILDETKDPWFIGKEVCAILGTETRDLRKILDNDEISNLDNIHIGEISTILDQSNGGRAPLIVSEAGLYKLIMRSRKENAKPFQRWVTHEVLPSIRKHGAYMTEQTLEQALTDPDFLIRLATELKEEKQARLQAEQKIQELEPKAKLMEDFINLDSTYSVADTAKLLRNVGIHMGQNQLYQQLAQMHWIFRREGAWKPYETHVQAGHLALRPYTKQGKHSDGTPFAYQPQVRLTGRGIMLLTRRLSEQQLQQTLQTAL